MQRKLWGALATAALVAGCAQKLPADQAKCWSATQYVLRSPSTAKLIKAINSEDDVFLTIDAANAFGTPVRGIYHCTMKSQNGGRFVDAMTVDGQEVDPSGAVGG